MASFVFFAYSANNKENFKSGGLMANQKLEALLGLALSVEEAERQKSGQLGVGFIEETRKWELIVKYNGDIGRLQSDIIGVEELIAGY